MNSTEITNALLPICDKVLYYRKREYINKRDLTPAVQGKQIIITYYPEGDNIVVEIYGHKISTVKPFVVEAMRNIGYEMEEDGGVITYIPSAYKSCDEYRMEFYKR